jgi:hypothetical protein
MCLDNQDPAPMMPQDLWNTKFREWIASGVGFCAYDNEAPEHIHPNIREHSELDSIAGMCHHSTSHRPSSANSADKHPWHGV